MSAEWWPAWAGETVVVVCSGPSARLAPLHLAQGRARVVVVNESWRLAPWADACYSCDWPWWAHRGPTPDQFPGDRVSGRQPSDSEARHQLDATQREFMAGLLSLPVFGGERHKPPILPMDGPVTGGSMSGFQVVGRLAQARVARILLVGVDCIEDQGRKHWHGPHAHPNGSNPAPSRIRAWIAQWTRAAPELKSLGIEVVNCSMESGVECFTKQKLKSALGA